MDSGHPYILRGDSFLIEFLLYVHQAIADASVREQFIDDILKESQKTVLGHEKEIKELFATLNVNCSRTEASAMASAARCSK
jgi:hypothetical protein